MTGKELFRKTIDAIASGSDSPDKNPDDFRYHVQHTFGSLVGQVRNSRSWGEEPDKEDLELLIGLLYVVPNVLEYYPEDGREDLKGFLKSESFI